MLTLGCCRGSVRYLRPVALAAVLALAAGCAGTTSPTGSALPPAATTSTAATQAATATTAAATLIPYPGPSIPSGTLTLPVVAASLAYSVSDLTAPAGTPFAIHFDNEDAGVSHNLAIRLGLSYLFNPAPVPGVTTVDYFISSGLPAGKYRFLCTVHPETMLGTLTIH
jgi:plastocyanin